MSKIANQSGRMSMPRADRGFRKNQAIQKLTRDLLQATQIPELSDAIDKLEQDHSIPTRGVHYDFGSLLDKTKLTDYDEFRHLQKGANLPEEVGEFNLDPMRNMLSRSFYINPILRKASEAGYEVVKVGADGIIFYLKIEDLKPNALGFYRRFFFTEEETLTKIQNVIDHLVQQNDGAARASIYGIKICGKSLDHIRLTYQDIFTVLQLKRIRWELHTHYQRMSFMVKNFFYDRNLKEKIIAPATCTEPTVLKIHFDLQNVLPRISKKILESHPIKLMNSEESYEIETSPCIDEVEQ